MKLRSILNEINYESKNLLYHATDFNSLKGILTSGFIQPHAYREMTHHIDQKVSGYRTISLTRNLNFAKSWNDIVICLN